MDYYYGTAEGDNILLSSEELNHLKNVKRIKPGDTVMVTDGKGNLYTTEFTGTNTSLRITNREAREQEKHSIHIAVAPTKSIDRIEWFLEKAIETGIDRISFIQCRHSERKEIKAERLMRVAIAAIKQSNKIFLPEINDVIPFSRFIGEEQNSTKLIFTQSGSGTLKKNYSPGNSLLAVIGPEGDFHDDELRLAQEHGFVSTSLGSSRLRTETAALTVCTLFNFMNAQ